MNDKNNFALRATTSSGLVTSSLFGSLIATLATKGVLTDGEVHEIYESALLSLEENRASADSPDFAEITQAACQIIEDALNDIANRYGTPES